MKKETYNIEHIFLKKKIFIIIILIGIFFQNGINILLHYYAGKIIDTLKYKVPEFSIIKIILLIVTVYIVLNFVLPYMKTKLNADLSSNIMNILQNKLLISKQSDLDKKNIGELSTIYTSDTLGIISCLERIINVFIPDIVLWSFTIFLMFFIHPILGIICIITASFPIFFMIKLSEFIGKSNENYQNTMQTVNQGIAEGIYNIEFVKSNQLEDIYGIQERKRKLVFYETILSIPSMGISFLIIICIAIVGGYLSIKNSITIGEFFTAISLADYVISPIMRLDSSLSAIRKGKVNKDRLNKFFNMKIENIYKVQKKEEITEKNSSISCHNITFEYENGKEVYHSFSHIWEAGKLHLLAGENGAGKSTLIKLFMGVYEIQQGQLFFNQKEIKEDGYLWLRENMVVFTQDIIVFAGTIKENIICGNFQITLEEIRKMADIVGIDKEIMKMPDQYETSLTEGGNPLSVGQKQRICLVRTFLREGKAYYFDEPTSALDEYHLKKVWQQLKKLSKERLVLVVSHDACAKEWADTITEIGGMDKYE